MEVIYVIVGVGGRGVLFFLLEEFIMFCNWFVFFGGFFVVGEWESCEWGEVVMGGVMGMFVGFFEFGFWFCWSEFLINDVVEIFKLEFEVSFGMDCLY